MIKQKIYIDTPVIGGCFDDEFSEVSNRLFEEFKSGRKVAVVSNITTFELEKAPENVKNKLNEIPEQFIEKVILSVEAEELSNKYISENVISPNFIEDARHIAIATIMKIDVLASWNFKHIVNLKRIHGYNAVNLKEGYQLLEIRSPMEVLDEE
jgi:PIN domain nuclease of toxin-antitoxin system